MLNPLFKSGSICSPGPVLRLFPYGGKFGSGCVGFLKHGLLREEESLTEYR